MRQSSAGIRPRFQCRRHEKKQHGSEAEHERKKHGHGSERSTRERAEVRGTAKAGTWQRWYDHLPVATLLLLALVRHVPVKARAGIESACVPLMEVARFIRRSPDSHGEGQKNTPDSHGSMTRSTST